MTKEEIIDNIIYRQTDGEEYACLKKEDCMNAMQEYADQETERLKAELSELKERHKKDVDMFLNRLAIIKEWLEPNPVIDLGGAKQAIEYAEQYYKQNFETNK